MSDSIGRVSASLLKCSGVAARLLQAQSRYSAKRRTAMRQTSKRPPVSAKLEAVLGRLCQRMGKLSMTQAVKLPYIVDVIARNESGRPIANATYQCWQYGVVASEAFSGLKRCESFAIEEIEYSEGSTWVKYLGSEPDLTPAEIEIVDRVAREYGRLKQSSLGLLTKMMNTHIPKWGSNMLADTSADAYEKLRSSAWQSACKSVSDIDFENLPTDKEIETVGDFLKLVS